MSEFSPKLSSALSQMMVQQPFFASLLFMQCTLVEAESHPQLGRVPTGATNGKIILINPKFIEPLSVKQVVHLLCHEVGHVMFLHMRRAKRYIEIGCGPDMLPFNPKKWNYATDYVINAMLVACKIGEKIDGGLYDAKYTGDELADDVYVDITIPPDDGDGSGSGEGHGGFDHHIPEGTGEVTEAEMANMNAAIQAAAAAAQAMGKMPDGLKRLIDQVLDPTLPWQEILRREAAKISRNHDNDWARPNRRGLASGSPIIMPSKKGESSGSLVVVVDTSGSIGNKEISRFMGELVGIYEDFPPEETVVLWTDTEVAGVYRCESLQDVETMVEEVLRDGAPGGGGTDMPAAFRWCAEHGVSPSQCVVFTDGETPYSEEPPFQVIWCMTTNHKAPYGVSVKCEV